MKTLQPNQPNQSNQSLVQPQPLSVDATGNRIFEFTKVPGGSTDNQTYDAIDLASVYRIKLTDDGNGNKQVVVFFQDGNKEVYTEGQNGLNFINNLVQRWKFFYGQK